MTTRRFLVTGGAGYVGSHLVAALLDRGDAVTVLDNLRTGHRAAVPAGARLVVADLADAAAIEAVLSGAEPGELVSGSPPGAQIAPSQTQPAQIPPPQILSGQLRPSQTVAGQRVAGQTVAGQAVVGQAAAGQTVPGGTLAGCVEPDAGSWDAVFHFASLSQVGESMRIPMRYLLDNAANGIRLIDACVRHGVGRFVLSSTAALFNLDSDAPIPEEAPIDPQSPYGDSKWMIERALRWAGQVHGLRHACLRYFNAAGADPAGRLGEDHRPESHLIPLVIDAALGRRAALDVFGDDYPTPDGTCIRDYVHVSDLASAHLLALEALQAGSVVWNLGNGAGHSVRQVIASVERVSGLKVPYRIVDRRAGDAAVLVASSERARLAGWRPVHGDLDDIVATAFAWRKSHPDGYGD